MFPSMVFCILSLDDDFVADMTNLLLTKGADVYAVSSFAEYGRLQAEGVVPEMLVVDPYFRIAG